MNPAWPTALIGGIDHFVAKKLAKVLLDKDINVIGVGEYVGELIELEAFKYVENLEEVEEKISYVFDFQNAETIWKKAEENKAKLAVILANGEPEDKLETKLKERNINWRIVRARGVYGPGMREMGFIAHAFQQAVLNQNLVLPSLSKTYRILAVDDLVEGVLRASFLSGTEGETFLFEGSEINSEEVAKVLIDEAKMTRFKVIQGEIQIESLNEEELEATKKKLRWKPEVEFSEGAKETLQYFFSKIDEEARKTKKTEVPEVKIDTVEKEIKKESPAENKRKQFEVVVEDETEDKEKKENVVAAAEPTESQKIPEISADKYGVKAVDSEEEDEVVEIEYEKQKRLEITPFVLKNSNLRPIATKEMTVEEKKEEVVEEEQENKVIEKKEILQSRIQTPIKRQSISRKIPLMLIIIIICFCLVPLNWLRVGWQGINEIQTTEALIKDQKFTEAETLINQASNNLSTIDEQISEIQVNEVPIIRRYQEILRIEADVLDLEKKTIGLAKSGAKISGAVFNNSTIDWSGEIVTVRGHLVETENEIGVVQARLNSDWNWLPSNIKKWLQDKSGALDKSKATMEAAIKTVDMLPELLGVDGKRRDYLVLFQNENELRPGGGFIGSYGILSFQNGKLIDFEIKDIYDADGQLKGHVDPPGPIRDVLGEGGWYMRDANWSADFPTNAKDIQWFLDKELGKKVDGVVGIDLAVAKSILGVVGEVYIPDFKEKINKDNLYEQAEFYAETKFFPGSKQKASFLGGLGKQLFEEIKTMKTEKQLGLVQALVDMLEKNEIQMSFNRETAAEWAAAMGWDGAIYQGKCAGERCVADYLYIVEANLGVNKANYFLTRNIEEMVDIKSPVLERTVKINYENTAKSSNWPGGDYKNYMRIYLPSDVSLEEISAAEADSQNSRKIYSSNEISINTVKGKKEIGFLVTVPVGKKQVVEIKYGSQLDFGNSDKFSYLNYIQKQSGFGDSGMVTLINLPPEWKPTQVQPAASVIDGKLLFNQTLDKDIKMGVEMGK